MLTVWNSLPFFLRVNRCVFDLTGLEPVTHLLSQSVFPLTPSVNINRLYSDNLKPQVTVMSLIFERSRASGSNRSTWKMKKMWLVRMTRFGRALYEFWVRCLLPIGLHPHITLAHPYLTSNSVTDRSPSPINPMIFNVDALIGSLFTTLWRASFYNPRHSLSPW